MEWLIAELDMRAFVRAHSRRLKRSEVVFAARLSVEKHGDSWRNMEIHGDWDAGPWRSLAASV